MKDVEVRRFGKNEGVQKNLSRAQFYEPLHVAYTEQGQTGNRTHITREDQGLVPTSFVRNMRGVNDERPGEHRNRRGSQWEDFKGDIAKHGIEWPLFITVDPGGRPKMSEGNHRRDAAVELGMEQVPVQIRYFGHAEREREYP